MKKRKAELHLPRRCNSGSNTRGRSDPFTVQYRNSVLPRRPTSFSMICTCGSCCTKVWIAASLSHPNILALHTFGEVSGMWYFVMGYARGVTLAARLRIEGRLPSEEAQRILKSHNPIFLVVGTVEPRKGHAQALAAFEQLWARGLEAELVIVGKQGWMVEKTVERMRGHVKAGSSSTGSIMPPTPISMRSTTAAPRFSGYRWTKASACL